ncbi:MAG: PKD domain-containing protein [Candidatus Diapherotrites archaeon]
MKKAFLLVFCILLAFVAVHADAKKVSLKINGFDADAQADAVILQGGPNKKFDLNGEIQNNLLKEEFKKDLDIIFILDASGSMQDEIDAVKGSIKQIMNQINNKCGDCFNAGLYVFEGGGSIAGFTAKSYCASSSDRGAIHLSSDGQNLKTRLGQVSATGSVEPWASLTNEILNDSSYGWRAEAVKAIIVVTDEPADPCGSCDSSSCHSYRTTEAGQTLLSKDAYFFGIVGTGQPANVKTDMKKILDVSKKGTYYDYTNASQIPDLILNAIWYIIGNDTFTVKREIGEDWDNIGANFEVKDITREGGKMKFGITLLTPPTYGQPFAYFKYRIEIKSKPEMNDAAWLKVLMGLPPVAEILALSPTTGDVPLTVQMNAELTTDPDGDIDLDTFEWDCNSDGIIDFTTTSKTQAVSCIYTVKDKTVFAKMTAKDKAGFTGSDQIAITTNKNKKPSVFLVYAPQPTHPTQDTNFKATATDPDGTIIKYDWDFGDFTVKSCADCNEVAHKYTSKGSFVATVTVTDSDNDTANDNETVLVANRPPNKPIMTIIPSSGFAPLITDLSASTTDPDGDQIVFWQWDYGDGSSLEICNCASRNHTYITDGSFSAMVRAQDNDATDPKWSEWSDPIVTVSIQNALTAFRALDVNAGEKPNVLVSCTDTALTALVEIRDFNGTLLKSEEHACDGSLFEPDYVLAKSGIYKAQAFIKGKKCQNCPKTIYFRASEPFPELGVPDAGPLSAAATLAAVLVLTGRKRKK